MIGMRERRSRLILFLALFLISFETKRGALAQMISEVAPAAGPAGTSVTITGSDFGRTQEGSTVTFNGTPAAVTRWMDGQVIATVPENASTGPVVVTVNGESSNDDHLLRVIVPTSPATLSSLSPSAAPRNADATGTVVTITGSGFGEVQGSSTVTFNGIPAAVVHWSNAEIRAKIPEEATTGPVVVTVHEEPSNPIRFTVYPSILSLSPSAGPVGTPITIEGAHFGPTQDGGAVTFNGRPASVLRWIDRRVIALVPDGATSGPVAVTVHGAVSNTHPLFTVRSDSRPTISSLFPTSGPSGTSVLILGTGFGRSQGGVVTFNGTPASVLSWTETQLLATVPDAATTGPVRVTVHQALSNSDPIFTSTAASSFSLASIILAPAHPTLTVGQTVTLTPTGLFKNGFTQTLNRATVAAGISHSCAVLSEGTVVCWGENAFGQLGNGSAAFSLVPVRVVGIDSATSIAAGGAHSCALLSEGRVTCWGDNAAGQLGNGNTAPSAIPVEVTGITDAVAITAGRTHTCAVSADGAIRCWGVDTSGPLGSGHLVDSSTPVAVRDIIQSAPAVGETFACELLLEGGIHCWGENTFGQLGNGTTTRSATPVRVEGIRDAQAFAAGSYHACAVLSNGRVACWGAGTSGQLGNGKNAGSATPVIINGINSAAAVVWTSSDPAVATVDPNGRVTAHRPGLATVSATSRGVSGSTTLLVESPSAAALRPEGHSEITATRSGH